MTKTTLTIDGMACSMCEAHVSEAIRKVCVPKKLRVSHKTGKAEILAEQTPDEASLRRAVEATGYQVLHVESEPYQKRGLFGW
jgi:copper chaperone CopZ